MFLIVKPIHRLTSFLDREFDLQSGKQALVYIKPSNPKSFWLRTQEFLK
jgi:hypothetical protein